MKRGLVWLASIVLIGWVTGLSLVAQSNAPAGPGAGSLEQILAQDAVDFERTFLAEGLVAAHYSRSLRDRARRITRIRSIAPTPIGAKAAALLEQENRLIQLLKATGESKLPITLRMVDEQSCFTVAARKQPECADMLDLPSQLAEITAASMEAQEDAYRNGALPAEDALAAAAQGAGLRVARVLKQLSLRMSAYPMAAKGLRAIIKTPAGRTSTGLIDIKGIPRGLPGAEAPIQDILIDDGVDLEDMLNQGSDAKYTQSIQKRERLMDRVRAMPRTGLTGKILAHMAQENRILRVFTRNLARTQLPEPGALMDLPRCMFSERDEKCKDAQAGLDEALAGIFEGFEALVAVYRNGALAAEDVLAAAAAGAGLEFDRVLMAYGVKIVTLERGIEVRRKLPLAPVSPLLPPPVAPPPADQPIGLSRGARDPNPR